MRIFHQKILLSHPGWIIWGPAWILLDELKCAIALLLLLKYVTGYQESNQYLRWKIYYIVIFSQRFRPKNILNSFVFLYCQPGWPEGKPSAMLLPGVHWHEGSPSSAPFVTPSPSESASQICLFHVYRMIVYILNK